MLLAGRKIGWGDDTTSEPSHPHEIIEFSFPGRRRITKKAVEIYEKGHSIAETALITGLPKTSLFEAMKANKIPTRPLWRAGKPNAAYGYAWLSGEIVKNPAEYKTVLIIVDLSKTVRRPHQIAKFLNENGIKPRRGKMWFARTVTDIISRNK